MAFKLTKSTNPVFKKVEFEAKGDYVDPTSVNQWDNTIQEEKAVVQETFSFSGVLIKTAILFGTALLSGILFVFLAFSGVFEDALTVLIPLAFVAPLLAFVFAMVGTLNYKAAPVCSFIYSALEGIFFGVLIGIFEIIFPGIAVTAISTLAVIFCVSLGLYMIKAIRVTSKFLRTMMVIGASVVGVALVNVVIVLFVPNVYDTIYTGGLIWVLVLIDLFMIIYGAMMLVMDFDRAKAMADSGTPKKYEWQVSLGLMVTLAWLLVYILRLLLIVFSAINRNK